jgi:nitrogenase-associated protein
MSLILFFEKPGCRNNDRQKAMLVLSGNTVESINLLEHPWTREELGRYLGNKPMHECFNPSAPAIKSGEIDPMDYSIEETLDMMIRDPVLIKRPLMKIGNHHIQGFDTAALRKIISLNPVPGAEKVVESMRMTDMNTCTNTAYYSCTTPEH